MSAIGEQPSTNVLTITRPTPARQPSNQSLEIESTDRDSTHSFTPSHTNSHDGISPYTKSSPLPRDTEKSESKQNINALSPYDTDVEALTQEPTTSSRGYAGLLKTNTEKLESAMWPGHAELKIQKKTMRRARGKGQLCNCMAGLSKKTKVWVKILIGLLVVGAAVGLSIGISKAVGGGVWRNSSSSNAPISSR